MAVKPSKEMVNIVQRQIQREYESAYIYLGMSIYFETESLTGMAHWMYKQYEEEIAHGQKWIHFLLDINEVPQLSGIPKVDVLYNSPVDVFEKAIEHEDFINNSIDEITELADKENFNRIRHLLNWFMDEQVQEEKTFTEAIDRLKMSKDNLLIIDKELGCR